MSVKVEFKVTPSCDYSYKQKKCKEIVKWYKRLMHDYEMYIDWAKNIVIKHISKNTYQLSFKIQPEVYDGTMEQAIFIAEMIVDPDEDGNYPLSDNENVSGTLVENTLVYKAYKKKSDTKKSETKKSETKKKRCPNGSRRYPPKTGECIEKNK
jgi:hypothetical protein